MGLRGREMGETGRTEKRKIVQVEVRFTLPVEVPDKPDYDVDWDIEERQCAGTGPVYAAIKKLMDKHEAAGTCWACAIQAECEVLESTGKSGE